MSRLNVFLSPNKGGNTPNPLQSGISILLLNLKNSLFGSPERLFFCIIIFFCITPVGLSAFSGLLKMMKTSNFKMDYPTPHYGLLSVPTRIQQKTLGADFAQVYFSSQALQNGDSPYFPQNIDHRDPFGRQSAYPPFTVWLYQLLSQNQDFYTALIEHNLIELFLFLLAALYLMVSSRISIQAIALCMVSIISLLFLTPNGLSHFERGQFELYSATALLLLTSGVRRHSHLVVLLSAFFASIKWVILPAYLYLLIIYFFTHTSPLSKRAALFSLPILFIVSTVIFFPMEAIQYYDVIRFWELTAWSGEVGFSFQRFLPKIYSKSIVLAAFMIIALFAVFSSRRRRGLFTSQQLPIIAALCSINLGFGSISYEYRAITLLALIPLMTTWLKLNAGNSTQFQSVIASLVATHLLVLFRTGYFSQVSSTSLSLINMLFCVFYSLILCIQYAANRYRYS